MTNKILFELQYGIHSPQGVWMNQQIQFNLGDLKSMIIKLEEAGEEYISHNQQGVIIRIISVG